MNNICSKIKKINKSEAEDLFSSASFPLFYSCFNEKCNYDKDKCNIGKLTIIKYLRFISEKYPWLIPSGEDGIEKILLSIKNSFAHKPIEDNLQKEIEQRKDYLETNNTRKYLPNPGILLIDNNTCYLSNLIFYPDTDDDIKNSETFKNFLEVEKQITKNAELSKPKYCLPLNFNTCLKTDVKEKSDMLPYYIKRWFEIRSITPDSYIAATGEIEGDKIKSVGFIDIKIKAALEFGYKHIFYPKEQKEELIKSLGDLMNTPKLEPVSTLDELDQRLLFLSEYRHSKTYLKQYLEGTRNIKRNNLKKHIKKYIKGVIGIIKPKNLFNQFNNFLNSCSNIILTRKYNSIKAFFDLIESNKIESLSKDINFKLSFINSLLPKPIWFGILPFMIKSLYQSDRTRNIASNLYQNNIENFYNHNICMTVANRLNNQLRYKYKFYDNRELLNNYPHLWGISSFDPIWLLSELSSIQEKNFFEEDLFYNLFKEFINIFKTHPESIYSIGIFPQKINKNLKYKQNYGIINSNNYFKSLQIVIGSRFPGFNPQKFRFLRWDQKLGTLFKIIFNLSKNRNIYNEYINELYKITDKLLEYPIFYDYKKESINIYVKNALHKQTTYENKNGIKQLLDYLESNEVKDSFVRILRIILFDNNKIINQNKSSIISKMDYYLNEKKIINLLFKDLKNNFINLDKINTKLDICINPIYEIHKLLITKNESHLVEFFKKLNDFSFDFEHIYTVTGIASSIAYYLGKYYNGNIPKELINSKINNYSTIFLLSYYFNKKNYEKIEELKIEDLEVDERSIILLMNEEEKKYLSKIICSKESSKDKDIITKKLFVLSGVNIENFELFEGKELFEITTQKSSEISWNKWRDKVKNDLLEAPRNCKKMYFLDMLWNHPKEFLKLPFSEIDPENYSLTILYLVSLNKYSGTNNKSILKKIKRKIISSSNNLFDLDTIQAINLLYYFINKDYKKINKMILSDKLSLINLKLAFSLLAQKASK